MNSVRRAKLRAWIKFLPQFILVFTVLLVTAWITDKYIEAACFAISFCVLRYKFDNILHYSTTFKCMLFTNGLIVVFIPIVIPITNSIFGGLAVGFFVNYFANFIASNTFRMREKAELEALKEANRKKDIYSMSEEDLRKFCKGYMLDYLDEEIVVQRLIYNLKGQALYDKIGFSKIQIIRREKKIESKLQLKLKDH